MKELRKKPNNIEVDPKKLLKYKRGPRLDYSGIKHPLHHVKLKKKEKKIKYSEKEAAKSELLLTEEHGGIEVQEGEKSTEISQKIIAENVDIAAATKIFDLNLEFGPYYVKYTRNGRHLLLGGRKGHVAAMDWFTKKLHFEINVMESVHDVSWLHLETMVAVAQKEWLYIYDNTGTELHCIKRMDKILKLEFLPYHFLLAAVNEYGYMSWLDISIGEMISQFNNNMGRTNVMVQNPYNGTLCLGSSRGVVSIWSPNVKEPLAKILCHKSPLTAIAVNSKGMYMATTGVDRSMKIWDIRNLDGPLQHYKLRTAPTSLEFSQTEMLAVSLDNVVEVYRDCCSKTTERPYLRHRMAKIVNSFKFCPYEDVLGIGSNRGFSSIIVPGSGEPNFDALENNPFQTKKQRKEAEVKALLEKIPAELITLNPFEITEVDVPTLEGKLDARNKLLHLKPKKIDTTPRRKNKGQSRIKRQRIIKETARKEFIGQAIQAQKQTELPKASKTSNQYGVLNRFVSNTNSKK